MDFRENSRGITLIALVITIIVLLILAGVSLSLIAGGDGILGKAESGTKEYRIASARELLDLKLSEIDMDSYEKNLRKANFAEIVEKLADDSDFVIVGTELGQVSSLNKDISLPSDLNSLKAILVCSTSYTDVIFRISNEREITLWGEDVEVEVPEVQKYTVKYNANGGKNAPSSQTDESGKTVTISANKPTKRAYNFVGWSSNSNATSAEYSSGDNITLSENLELYAVWSEQTQAEKATKPEEHTPTGFSYKEGTVDTGYVITDGTNEFVWIPVANDEAYAKKIGSNNVYMKSGSSGTDTGLTVATAVKGDTLGVSKILGISVNSTLDANQPEYAVVKKAGGFWVGRYEAGVENETHGNITSSTFNSYWESKKTSIKVAQNMEPVRNITQEKSLSIANSWKRGSANENTNTVAFQSGLITGSQWDAMCKFIGWSTCDSDCTSWGNYSNTVGKSYTGYHSSDSASDWLTSTITKNGSGTNRFIFPTGKFVTSSNATTEKKNIYDVAGNVWEFTTEVPQYDASCCVLRGCSAYDENGTDFATVRGGSVSSSDSIFFNVGFRLVLYVE